MTTRRFPRVPEGATPIPADPEHGGIARPGVIDFSASINPLGPPPAALDAYHEASAAIQSYPSAYPTELARRIAEWIGVAPEELIVGNGSTHLIHLLARLYPVYFPYIAIPTFSEIANAFRLSDSTPCAIALGREDGFVPRVEQIVDAMNHRAAAVFIGRPNSPTGSMASLARAEEIVRECERFHALCVFDEAFIDFAGRRESAVEIIRSWPLRRRQGLMIIGSLTKIFAIPGLRVGYLVAPPGIVAEMRPHIEPWSINSVAERVALACLDGADDFARTTHEFVTREREYLSARLAPLEGIAVFRSAANFMMIEVAENDRENFGRFMLGRGIAVRDLRRLPGCEPGLYRVAIRKRDDNDRLIAAAREYVNH
jgi:threonine-phosphate decarboxylase